MALWTLPTLPRLAQSENATVTHAKTDSFVLLAVAGDVRGVRERLRLKQEIDAPHSKLGYMALHAAVDSGHFEVVTALLDQGSDVNVRRVGTLDTPAHLACSSAGLSADVAIAMLKLLRSRGANFRLVNHIGQRPLEVAIENRKLELVQFLGDLPTKMDSPVSHAVTVTRVAIHWTPPHTDPVGPHTYEIGVWDAEANPQGYNTEDTTPLQTYTRFGQECVLSGLSSGTLYHVCIRALNLCGWGPWSDPTPIRTMSSVPYPPHNVHVSGTNGPAVMIAWEPDVSRNVEAGSFFIVQYAYTVDPGATREFDGATNEELAAVFDGAFPKLLATALSEFELMTEKQLRSVDEQANPWRWLPQRPPETEPKRPKSLFNLPLVADSPSKKRLVGSSSELAMIPSPQPRPKSRSGPTGTKPDVTPPPLVLQTGAQINKAALLPPRVHPMSVPSSAWIADEVRAVDADPSTTLRYVPTGAFVVLRVVARNSTGFGFPSHYLTFTCPKLLHPATVYPRGVLFSVLPNATTTMMVSHPDYPPEGSSQPNHFQASVFEPSTLDCDATFGSVASTLSAPSFTPEGTVVKPSSRLQLQAQIFVPDTFHGDLGVIPARSTSPAKRAPPPVQKDNSCLLGSSTTTADVTLTVSKTHHLIDALARQPPAVDYGAGNSPNGPVDWMDIPADVLDDTSIVTAGSAADLLLPGTRYRFRYRVCNADASWPDWRLSCVTKWIRLADRQPEAPVNLTAEAYDPTTIQLQFIPQRCHGTPHIGFRIQRKLLKVPGSEDLLSAPLLTATGSLASLSLMLPEDGEEGSALLEGRPDGLNVWKDIDSVHLFRVSYATDLDRYDDWRRHRETWLVSNLVSGAWYTFRVCAVNAAGVSEYTTHVPPVTTYPEVPVKAPTPLVSVIGQDTLRIQWPIPVPTKSAPFTTCRLFRKKVRGSGQPKEQSSDSEDEALLDAARLSSPVKARPPLPGEVLAFEPDFDAATVATLRDADVTTWVRLSGLERKRLENRITQNWRARQKLKIEGKPGYEEIVWGETIKLPLGFGCIVGNESSTPRLTPAESPSSPTALTRSVSMWSQTSKKSKAYDPTSIPVGEWVYLSDFANPFSSTSVSAFLESNTNSVAELMQQVDRDVIEVFRWRTVNVSENQWVEIELTGFRAGSAHRFRVQYANGVGWGLPSDASMRGRLPCRIPDPPGPPNLFCAIELIPKPKISKRVYIRPQDMPKDEGPKYRRRPGVADVYVHWVTPHPHGAAVHTYVIEAKIVEECTDNDGKDKHDGEAGDVFEFVGEDTSSEEGWVPIVDVPANSSLDCFGTDFKTAIKGKQIDSWYKYDGCEDKGTAQLAPRKRNAFLDSLTEEKTPGLFTVLQVYNERMEGGVRHTAEGGHEAAWCVRIPDDMLEALLAPPPVEGVRVYVRFRVIAVNSVGRSPPSEPSDVYYPV